MCKKDIHIRRISQRIGFTNKTSVRLYEFLNRTIEQKNMSEILGEIDYVAVINNTNLDQDDYIGFLSFKNRKVHEIFVKKFNEPLLFAGREMVFELNYKETSLKLQKDNRERFQDNLKKYSSKRYFQHQLEIQDKDQQDTKKQKNEQSNLSHVNFVENRTEDIIPLVQSSSQSKSNLLDAYRLELKVSSLMHQVKMLEAQLAEKSAETDQLREERVRFETLEVKLAEKSAEADLMRRERDEIKQFLVRALELLNKP